MVRAIERLVCALGCFVSFVALEAKEKPRRLLSRAPSLPRRNLSPQGDTWREGPSCYRATIPAAGSGQRKRGS